MQECQSFVAVMRAVQNSLRALLGEYAISATLRRSDREIDDEAEGLILNALDGLPFRWNGISEEAGKIEGGTGECRGITFLIDPLDGTHNARFGYPYFSCSVALFVDGELLSGWVFDPLRDISYLGLKGTGAFCLWGDLRHRLRCNTSTRLSDSIIATFRPKSSKQMLEQQRVYLEAKKLRIGSCSSLDIAHVAAGVCDAFVDCSSRGHERDCDIAAAVAIVRESGGDVYNARTLDPVELEPPSLLSITERRPVIAACTSGLAKDILQSI